MVTRAPTFGAKRSRLFVGQRAGQVAQGLLVVFVVYLGEVAGDFQAHALTVMQLVAAVTVAKALKEMTDRNAEHLGDFNQPSGLMKNLRRQNS